MQKVITINLNGNAYQLDESGYDALHQYLADASRALESNPDRAEIVSDLEQAIAEKCQRFLGANKTVITAGEVEQIVREMGPIDAGAGGGTPGADDDGKTRAEPRPKRLVRIPEGGMIGGVCTGLGAYLNIDVTLIRIGFVIVRAALKGAGIIGYIIAMFVILKRRRPRSGQPPAASLQCQGIGRPGREAVCRRHAAPAPGVATATRSGQHYGGLGGAPTAYGPPPGLSMLQPLFGCCISACFCPRDELISLVNGARYWRWQLRRHAGLGRCPDLLVAYQIVVAPIRAAHHDIASANPAPPVNAFWNAVVGLTGLMLVVWIASGHGPEIREFLQRLPEVFRDSSTPFATRRDDVTEPPPARCTRSEPAVACYAAKAEGF